MKPLALLLAVAAVADAVPNPASQVMRRQTPPDNVTAFLRDGPRAMISTQKDSNAPIDITDTFLFRNANYFALQRYVIDGLKMPSKSEFETKYNATYLRPFLDKINAMIYPNAQNAFANVLEHCTGFHQTTLGDMTKFASNVKLWSQDFQNYYGKFAAVLQERLVQKDEEQIPTLRLYLKFIGNQALKAQNQCDSIANALKKFEQDTIKDEANLASLATELAEADPKSTTAREAYQTKLNALWATVHESEKQIAHKNWQLNVQGPSYAWVYPFGLITYLALMPGFKKAIAEAELARNSALRDIERFDKEIFGLNNVLFSIHDLQMQMKGVTDNAKEALVQVTTAKNSFQKMKSEVDNLLTHYGNADKITTDDYFLSKPFAAEILHASYNWGNVSALAKDFDGKSYINVVDLATAEKMNADMNNQKPLGV